MASSKWSAEQLEPEKAFGDGDWTVLFERIPWLGRCHAFVEGGDRAREEWARRYADGAGAADGAFEWRDERSGPLLTLGWLGGMPTTVSLVSGWIGDVGICFWDDESMVVDHRLCEWFFKELSREAGERIGFKAVRCGGDGGGEFFGSLEERLRKSFAEKERSEVESCCSPGGRRRPGGV